MSNLINYKSWQGPQNQFLRSHRGNRDQQPTPRVKKIVLTGLGLFILIYLIYYLFFSQYLTINKIEIAVADQDFNTEELYNYVKNIFNKKFLLIFPRNNYFLFSKNYLTTELNKKYVIEELSISKKFPDTLKISLKEKISNLLYQTNNNVYLINLNGKILSLVGERIIINEEKLIKIIDETSTEITINQSVLTSGLINLVLKIAEGFNNYLPNLKIKEYRVTSPQANFIKVMIENGPAIYFTDRLGLAEQLDKLKQSLEQEYIDLTKIQYINLIIKEQVIYK